MPDQAYRNALVACVFTALVFGTMLRLASRSAASSTLWLELAFGFVILVAIDWLVVRLYRQVRRLQDAPSGRHAA